MIEPTNEDMTFWGVCPTCEKSDCNIEFFQAENPDDDYFLCLDCGEDFTNVTLADQLRRGL